MANKVSAASGNWSTAGTWNSVTNTPTIHASTNVTLTSGGVTTATFTAPNITNTVTGIVIYPITTGNDGSVTVTLQENSAGWVDKASVSINNSDIKTATWLYLKLAVPYQFTAVTAGYYRWKISDNASVTAGTVAQSTTAGASAYLSTDDRTGAPAATDNVWIADATSTTTVTVDGAQSVGAGTYTTVLVSRTVGNGVSIGQSGVLNFDTTQSSTLTCKGNVLSYNGGELQIGTVASPYNSSYVAQLTFNPTATCDFGLGCNTNGKITLQGTPKSSTSLWKTKYVSGVGTAASPLVVADSVDWTVNDEILIGATNGLGQTEYKFIKTKNSATSYVLSDTVGGAESALSNTHTTDAWILNIERNVKINTNNSTLGFYTIFANATTGYINIDWTRFENIGSSTTNKSGVVLTFLANNYANCDYSVAYNILYRGLVNMADKNAGTHTGLIACKQNSSSATVGAFSFPSGSPASKTLTDCFAIGNNKSGFEFNTTIKSTLVRCYAIDCNTASDADSAGIYINNGLVVSMTDCEVHLNGVRGIYFNGLISTQIMANNLLCGTKGTNTIDIDLVTDLLIDAVFKNSNFGSATFLNNYLSTSAGSSINFHTLNDTSMNHKWYTDTGTAQSTGTGLTDTNVRTASSYALRLSPEDSTDGFEWSFKILAKASSAVQVLGFIQKNAAFGSDNVTVELWLPNSTSADATQTMGNDTSWNVFSLYANYAGTVDEYATVKIIAKSTAAGAYCYVDDIYNGTNKIIAFDTWDNGKPSSIMFEQLGDAAGVWAVLTSSLTTAGTTGKKLVDGLTTGKFLALK